MDWLIIAIYFVLVFFGWLNIYAAVYDAEMPQSIFNLSLNSGKQLLWIGTSILIIIVIITLDFRFYESFALVIYALVMVLLVLVLVAGREVAGSTSWFEIGSLRMQPSEFAKFATALGLARFASKTNFRLSKFSDFFIAVLIIVFPATLIMLQGDTGTALVFGAFVIVLYREGLNPLLIGVGLLAIALFIATLFIDKIYLISACVVLGVLLALFSLKKMKRLAIIVLSTILVVGVVISVDYFINDVLKPHQQNRIKALINPAADPLGYGWNVTQSKVAIGSGGLLGKGFLEGTQTNLGFVPEQSTDFIFCTLGEEHGWVGSLMVISLFVILFVRLIILAERQKGRFGRIYGYSVVAILFIHFMVNVGMTIGLFPVIGIPLPFFSYGGSSLWAFTALLFIFLKIDAHRLQVLER
jgi:rod shape determining protein RodA